MRVPGGDFFIGQYVSRGAGKDALDPVKPTIVIRPWHLQPSKWTGGYKNGVHGVIVKTLSYAPSALESRVKHDNSRFSKDSKKGKHGVTIFIYLH